MQHLGTEEELKQVWREIVRNMTLEERLEGLSPEQLVQTLSLEQRLLGLSPEELLVGLSPEQRAQLLELLQRQTPKKPPKRGKKA